MRSAAPAPRTAEAAQANRGGLECSSYTWQVRQAYMTRLGLIVKDIRCLPDMLRMPASEKISISQCVNGSRSERRELSPIRGTVVSDGRQPRHRRHGRRLVRHISLGRFDPGSSRPPVGIVQTQQAVRR